MILSEVKIFCHRAFWVLQNLLVRLVCTFKTLKMIFRTAVAVLLRISVVLLVDHQMAAV